MCIADQTSTASVYSDISGHWAQEAIELWSARGVLRGSNGLFYPDKPITRAGLAVVIDRIAGYQTKEGATLYPDVDENAWYADAMQKVRVAWVLWGGKPYEPVTRQQAMEVFWRVFSIYDDSQNEIPFADEAEVDLWFVDILHSIKSAGYIQGDTNGNFRPKDYMTRAVLVTVLSNIAQDFFFEPMEVDGSTQTGPSKGVIIRMPGVTLKNYTITGDLYIM